MRRHTSTPTAPAARRDRLIQEFEHDAYRTPGKLAEPTVCPGCQAVFGDGRWQWSSRPVDADEALCPACQRIEDDFPAGYVHLAGEFLTAHWEELLHLMQNEASREAAQHPMERIIATSPESDGLLVTTTGIHLARRLGEALHRAFQGELDFHYNEAEMLLRVHWHR